jgi:serine/threonine protein kinase
MEILNLQTVVLVWIKLMYLVLLDVLPPNSLDMSGDAVHISDYGIHCYSHYANTMAAGRVPGTLSYLAPEVLATSRHTRQSDMWAVGCIGYEICIGQKLSRANNREHIDTFIARGGTLDLSRISPRFGHNVRSIIRHCLAWDPTQRCSAAEVRDHILTLYPAPVAPVTNNFPEPGGGGGGVSGGGGHVTGPSQGYGRFGGGGGSPGGVWPGNANTSAVTLQFSKLISRGFLFQIHTSDCFA